MNIAESLQELTAKVSYGKHELVEKLLARARKQPGFDLTFLLSLQAQFKKSQRLTLRQRAALENLARVIDLEF